MSRRAFSKRETIHDFQFYLFFRSFVLLSARFTLHTILFNISTNMGIKCAYYTPPFAHSVVVVVFFSFGKSIQIHLEFFARRLRRQNLLQERECETVRECEKRRKINEFLPLSVSQFSYYIYIVKKKERKSFDVNTTLNKGNKRNVSFCTHARTCHNRFSWI